MRASAMNWMQVEAYLKRDDRAVLPIGSVEQHAYLSLATDSILAEKLALDVAEPLGVPVFPAVAYGFTPNFMAYPGTLTLRAATLCAIVGDLLDGLAAHGFRRVLVVNGHGGNAPAQAFVGEWLASHPGVRVRWHNWWNAPLVGRKVAGIDSHASWMENFPWTRLPDVVQPRAAKPQQPYTAWLHLGPKAIRERLGDGNFAGLYERDDDAMHEIWRVAIGETRALLEGGWD